MSAGRALSLPSRAAALPSRRGGSPATGSGTQFFCRFWRDSPRRAKINWVFCEWGCHWTTQEFSGLLLDPFFIKPLLEVTVPQIGPLWCHERHWYYSQMCNHTAAICFVLCGRSRKEKASELAGNLKKTKNKTCFARVLKNYSRLNWNCMLMWDLEAKHACANRREWDITILSLRPISSSSSFFLCSKCTSIRVCSSSRSFSILFLWISWPVNTHVCAISVA